MKKQNKPLTEEDRVYVEQVHDRTRSDVERYSRALTDRNSADTDDLTQETYTRFSERVGKRGPLEEDRPEKPYLLTTAKNVLRNQRRDNRLRLITLQSDAEEASDAHQDQKVSRVAGTKQFDEYAAGVRRSTYMDRFKELIPVVQSKLTADEWQLISLRWMKDMTFEEIAAIIGQPRDQVAYRTSKATAKARYWAEVLISRQNIE